MDESDRVVVLDSGKETAEEGEFQVNPGPQGEAAGIHRVLQRDDGEAVQVDVQRKTLSYLNFEMRLTPGCTRRVELKSDEAQRVRPRTLSGQPSTISSAA